MSDFTMFVPCELFTTNAERRLHHYARAAKVSDIRHKAKLYCLNMQRNKKAVPFSQPVHVEFHPTQKPGTLADVAGHLPVAKAVLDGVVDAGLLFDDNPEWVLSQRFWPPIKGNPTGMTITIRDA